MSREKKRLLETDLVDSLLAEEQKDSANAQVPSFAEDPGVVLSAQSEEDDMENLSEKTKPLAEPPRASDETIPVAFNHDYEAPLENEKTYIFGQEPTQRLDKSGAGERTEQIRVGRLVSAEKMVQGGGGGPVSMVEASLAQSENLRVAQTRILDLEKELERTRQENEQLIAAGETLRRKSEDLVARMEKAEINLREERTTIKEEKKLYKESIEDKDRESMRLREKIEELELRLESDLKKIRVRERELENRLELVKMEEAALIRSKDEIILDLKRKIDQLHSEVENYRGRSLELHKNMEADQERLRRTVRTLRLALSMLEDGDTGPVPLKKAE